MIFQEYKWLIYHFRYSLLTLKSQCIASYVTNIDGSNHASAKVYQLRLKSFDSFSSQNYNTTTDNLINSIKQGRQDPYQVLRGFVSYLQRNHSLSPTTLKQHVIIAKNFLEYYDVDISPRKFKLKVKLPKTVRKDKQALSKKDIINILNYCSDVRLKTYVMLLAATGMRATEALSIRDGNTFSLIDNHRA